MPAGSETPVPLPRTWRPLGVRLAGWVLGAVVVVVGAAAWWSFPPETRAAFDLGQRLTLLGFAGLGGAAMLALMRSRVEATGDRLVVVNGFRRREFAWPEVIAAGLPPGAPWATLDLADGTSVPAMGIQGSDGARAQRAIRELRSLLAEPGGQPA